MSTLGLSTVSGPAFGIGYRPGLYALLLGSGVSRAADVPTGWEVMTQLVEQLADVEGDAVPDEPALWYRERFDEPLTFSSLMERLAPTSAERQAIMARFLTRSDGEPVEPTAAHRAVAELMGQGFVRVVLTTNFDPLLEHAAAAGGVEVTVLSTPDQMAGALPLVHAGPTVIKLHGDYRDPRILTTETELREYDPSVDALLDRVLEDYGLLVCGWSGAHDDALRSAIDRSPSRRFTTYWTYVGEPDADAKEVFDRRDGVALGVTSADDFFGRLLESCIAIRQGRRMDPVPVAAAVSSIKRRLSGQQPAIDVHDEVRREIDRVRRLDVLQPRSDATDQIQAVQVALAELERLSAMVATLAYWGSVDTDRWWLETLPRTCAHPRLSGSLATIERPMIAGLMMAWPAGIAAVAAERVELLSSLLAMPGANDRHDGRPKPPVLLLEPNVLHVGDETFALYRTLRSVFVEHVGIGVEPFWDAWEHWQYLLYVYARILAEDDNVFTGFRPDIRIVDTATRNPVPVAHEWLSREVDRLGDQHPLCQARPTLDATQLAERLPDIAAAFGKAAGEADWRLIPPGGGGPMPTGIHYPGSFESHPDRRYGVDPDVSVDPRARPTES